MHYIAWVIGEGGVPYRDVFDMNLPGVYLIHAAVIGLLGRGDLAWRLFDLGWLAATGALESTPPPSDLVVPSATSPDGRMIAIPDAASTFHVEDVATGEVIWTFGPHPTRVTGLDWGGVTRIASSAEREPVDRWAFEPSVRVWSTTLVTMEQALPGIDNGPALFDSTLGRLFVTGRSSVTRWCK